MVKKRVTAAGKRVAAAKKKIIEVMISFDTTGSMYPCLSLVRRRVEETVRRLFEEIPGIRIGIIAHGDYCDADDTYVIKMLDLTENEEDICDFIRNVEATGGGDSPECYELVMHQTRSATWTSGSTKILVMIGDDVPHKPNEAQNYLSLDWRNELKLLLDADIHVYAVQALARRRATAFYEEVARKTKGYHLNLDQFSDVQDLIFAVCFKQLGNKRLKQFEAEIDEGKRMSRGVYTFISTMLGRKGKSARFAEPGLEVVHPGRFQVLTIDKPLKIRDFANEHGLGFKKGRGFYEFMKPEIIQEDKEVVFMDLESGDMFTGDLTRKMIGLPYGQRGKIDPDDLDDRYMVFVQSNSWNRKLIPGTKLLYEVSDWSE